MQTVRYLNESDAESYASLRRAALTESPLSFGASPATDVACSVEGAREQLRQGAASIIIGAFDSEQLIGAVGVLRARHEKAQHKVHLWGMYVSAAYRNQDVGAALLDAAVSHARALPQVSWLQLGVTSAAPAARRLYERAGFSVWGTEPDALRHDGESVVEYHMALKLR